MKYLLFGLIKWNPKTSLAGCTAKEVVFEPIKLGGSGRWEWMTNNYMQWCTKRNSLTKAIVVYCKLNYTCLENQQRKKKQWEVAKFHTN